jgi:hypothetical protein
MMAITIYFMFILGLAEMGRKVPKMSQGHSIWIAMR